MQLPISSPQCAFLASGSFDQICSKVKTVLLLINQPGGAAKLLPNFNLAFSSLKPNKINGDLYFEHQQGCFTLLLSNSGQLKLSSFVESIKPFKGYL